MSVASYEAGDVKVIGVEVTSRSSGGKINLIDQLASVFIYEDMTQPSMVAELLIQDNINIIHDLPIIGEEDVVIEFGTPGLKPIKLTFQTTAVENKTIQDNNKGVLYTLKVVSKEHFVSSRNNIKHSFTGTIDQMVATIVGTYLETSKPIDVDPCKGNQTIVIPFQPTFQAIDMLRKRAVHANYPSSAFVFYENQDGYNFKCLETLISKRDPGTRKFNYQADVTSDKETEARSYRTIIDYADITQIDTNRKVTMGGLHTRVRSYDFIKKKVEEVEVKYEDKFPGFQKSDGKSRDQITGTMIREHGNKPALVYFIPRNTKAPENYLPDMVGQRIMYTTFLNQQTVRVLVHGDSSLKVGQVIELDLPESVGTTGRNKDKKYTGGLFLIKTLCHIITFGTKSKHQISMDCVKMGYSV